MHRILVIDDEEQVAETIQESLSFLGYRVDIAADGEEGLSMYCVSDYDLVITDICMPGKDGNSVARAIRDSGNSSIPILAISGTPWLMAKNIFDRALPKPFSMRALSAAVKELTEDSFPSAVSGSEYCATATA